MKVLKGFLAGIITVAAAVVTLGSTSVHAQDERGDFGRMEDPMGPGRGGPGRGGPGRGGPGGPRRPGRTEYLGTTGLVGKGRFEVREIYVGVRRGDFQGLEFTARDDDFEISRITVYFGRGRMNAGGAIVRENGRVTLDFRQYRGIDSVVIEGRAANILGSKAQLEVAGIR